MSDDDKTTAIYGPPGTGKTTRLTLLAERAAQIVNPDRICSITYTKPAALELQNRLAAALGKGLALDERLRDKQLRVLLPWVGTIHSQCLKLFGYPAPKVMGRRELKEFIASMGGKGEPIHGPDDMEGYTWAEPDADEVAAALAVISMARHRLLPADEAWLHMQWGPKGPTVTADRVVEIAQAYADFKRQQGCIDFEDMLEQGLRSRPDVDIVFADEVQDNSPLLWQVVDYWRDGRKNFLAGDPWQAIYLYSGAAPELFIERARDAAKFISLGDSRRLTQSSAETAQSILRQAGHGGADWLATWTGVGLGQETDGTEFWLARTGKLVSQVARRLEDDGVPYSYVRGGGPLAGRDADAYRTMLHLRENGAAPAYGVARLAERIRRGFLPYGEAARLKKLANADPEMPLSYEDLKGLWGRRLLDDAGYGLEHGEYYERVLAQHGRSAFVLPPKTRIGTIHSAKGREADTVHLVSSWAFLPYQAIQASLEGARAEGCVAYVAATRHRQHLIIESDFDGNSYPAW